MAPRPAATRRAVAPSVRYADPRLGLLEGEGWASARPFICRTLGLPPTPAEALAALRQQLDHTYRAVAANLPHNDAVRIEPTRRARGTGGLGAGQAGEAPRWWPYARR